MSGDTLLRLIRSARWEAPKALRVIGIDEWAWKRGQTYGTILCDLEKGRVLDLLPNHEAGTVSAWLKRHPGVTVIARDRATVFAQAMRDGAPQATQTADRWHLLHNLGDALRAAVGRHRCESAWKVDPYPFDTQLVDKFREFNFLVGSRSTPIVTPPTIKISQNFQQRSPDQARGYTSTLFHNLTSLKAVLSLSFSPVPVMFTLAAVRVLVTQVS